MKAEAAAEKAIEVCDYAWMRPARWVYGGLIQLDNSRAAGPSRMTASFTRADAFGAWPCRLRRTTGTLRRRSFRCSLAGPPRSARANPPGSAFDALRLTITPPRVIGPCWCSYARP